MSAGEDTINDQLDAETNFHFTFCILGIISIQVSGIYETGKALIDIGVKFKYKIMQIQIQRHKNETKQVIPGSDITPEAALTKLSYVLGKENWGLDERR